MSNLTWKSVFLIWLVALPIIGGVGYLAYRQNPAPFLVVAGWAQDGYQAGLKAYHDHQKQEAAKKKKAEDEAKKAAESESQASGWE